MSEFCCDGLATLWKISPDGQIVWRRNHFAGSHKDRFTTPTTRQMRFLWLDEASNTVCCCGDISRPIRTDRANEQPPVYTVRRYNTHGETIQSWCDHPYGMLGTSRGLPQTYIWGTGSLESQVTFRATADQMILPARVSGANLNVETITIERNDAWTQGSPTYTSHTADVHWRRHLNGFYRRLIQANESDMTSRSGLTVVAARDSTIMPSPSFANHYPPVEQYLNSSTPGDQTYQFTDFPPTNYYPGSGIYCYDRAADDTLTLRWLKAIDTRPFGFGGTSSGWVSNNAKHPWQAVRCSDSQILLWPGSYWPSSWGAESPQTQGPRKWLLLDATSGDEITRQVITDLTVPDVDGQVIPLDNDDIGWAIAGGYYDQDTGRATWRPVVATGSIRDIDFDGDGFVYVLTDETHLTIQRAVDGAYS